MKCKQSNDVSTLAQIYSPVFKKTSANSERVTHESYIKLISWVALYSMLKELPFLGSTSFAGLRPFSLSLKQSKINLQKRVIATGSSEDVVCCSKLLLDSSVVFNLNIVFSMLFEFSRKWSNFLHLNVK